jgi:hypothetical protein
MAKECDICHEIYKDPTVTDTSKPQDNLWEFQEFHLIRFTGGYGSVFGDGTEVECDICQHCLEKMIKGHYRIVGEE